MKIALRSSLDIVSIARHVIQIERDGLKALSDTIDDNFVKATHLIYGAKGRVIISGMGKSGHIGAKLSSTFASTGTPAFFVHPAEASHGDLGMITCDDVVICLSNSGETSELSDLIAFTRRYNIPLIGIASRKESTLTKGADVALVIPNIQEACPNGLAPTTSTTMMLALGDALAVALMEMRGFTPDNFRKFHPGGKLGAKLLKVADLMHVIPDIPLVRYNQPMSEVLLEMTSKAFGCTGVVDKDGLLIGVITDGDLRRAMSDNFLKKLAHMVMGSPPHIISGDRFATEAVAVLQAKSITGLFVVDKDKKPLGLLHIHDCLRSGVI